MTVIVYSTPTCPYCNMLKQFLDEKGVQYEDVDISADPTRAQEMIDKSGQMAVPVADVNGKVIIGFNKEAVEAALSGAEAAPAQEQAEEVVESEPGPAAPGEEAEPGPVEPGEMAEAPEEVVEPREESGSKGGQNEDDG